MLQTIGSLMAVLLVTSAVAAQTVQVDTRIEPYEKVSGISGGAGSIGSDTMNNLMALWLEGFRKHYPSVKIQIEGKGSSTAPPALIEGTAQFGPMSRAMKASEVDKFEARFGYKPTPLRTSLDALAVFVNKDNPIDGLAIPQVDAIFSKTRRGGLPGTSAPGVRSDSPGPGPTSPSVFTVAIRPQGPTAFSRRLLSSKGTTRTR